MRRIEAIIRSEYYPEVRDSLEKIGVYIVDKRSVSDSKILHSRGTTGAGSQSLRSVALYKLEVVVPDKDAHKAVKTIVQKAGLHSKNDGTIYVSPVEEIIDVSTMKGVTDLEEGANFLESLGEEEDDRNNVTTKLGGSHVPYGTNHGGEEVDTTNDDLKTYKPRKNRLVPLQKYTLGRVEETFEKNKQTLRDEYRIKSFSDFVNFCVMGYLPIIEGELKDKTIQWPRASVR